MKSPSPRRQRSYDRRRSPSPRQRGSPSPRRRSRSPRRPYRRSPSPRHGRSLSGRASPRSRSPRRRSPGPRQHSSPKTKNTQKRPLPPRSRSPKRMSPSPSRKMRRNDSSQGRGRDKEPEHGRRLPSGPHRSPVRRERSLSREQVKERDRSPLRQPPPNREMGRFPPRDGGMGKERMRGRGGGARGRGRAPHAFKSDVPASQDMDYRGMYAEQGSASLKAQRFDCTGTALNDRFGSKADRPFTPRENITIGIERNIPGDSPSVIPPDLSVDDVAIVRRKEEGLNPLYRREEFVTQKEADVEERRVIRVVAPEFDDEPMSRSFDERRGQVDVEYGRGPSRVSLSHRWGPGGEKQEMVYPRERLEVLRRDSISNEELDKYLLSHGKTKEGPVHGDLDERVVVGNPSGQLQEDVLTAAMMGHGDMDERMVMERKRPAGAKEGDEDFREKEKFERDPNDLRHNLSSKRKGRKDDIFDARQKILKKREDELKKREDDLKRRAAILEKKDRKEDGPEFPRRSVSDKDGPGQGPGQGQGPGPGLPDFSKRPDKYRYEEWKDDPEQIPKGRNYYEHDNRGEFEEFMPPPSRGSPPTSPRGSYKPNFRGNYRGNHFNPNYRGNHFSPNYRGSFRGRGFRGSYSSRGRGTSSSYPSYSPRGPGGGPGGTVYIPRGDRGDTRQARRGMSPRSVGREWKHDKYKDLEDDTDNKPTSTT